MTNLYPAVGQWFRRPNGTLFEVVAVDEDDGTVDLQQFDGTLDEIEFENWIDMILVEVSAPEDWSGSFDMDPEDFVGRADTEMPVGFHDALDYLDTLDS